jgi:hypothetical protein
MASYIYTFFGLYLVLDYLRKSPNQTADNINCENKCVKKSARVLMPIWFIYAAGAYYNK